MMEDTDIAIDLENHSTGVKTATLSASTDLDNPSNRKGHETETKKSNVSSDLLKVCLLHQYAVLTIFIILFVNAI